MVKIIRTLQLDRVEASIFGLYIPLIAEKFKKGEYYI